MSDSTRESLFCQEKKLAVSVNIETAKLDEAIVKAKELVALLREANEFTNKIPIDPNEKSKNHCLEWYCTSHWLSSLYDDFLHERTAGEVMPCVTCERKSECQTSPPVNFVPLMEKTGVKINTTFNSEKRCQS